MNCASSTAAQRCCQPPALLRIKECQEKRRVIQLNRKGCHREAEPDPKLKLQGKRPRWDDSKREDGDAGSRKGTYRSSRFCPTHTRPPCRGVGLLQDLWRTWKPMPQVVLQGDHKVQGVQPPLLGEEATGSLGPTGSEPSLCLHPPPNSHVPDTDHWLGAVKEKPARSRGNKGPVTGTSVTVRFSSPRIWF